MDSFLKRYSAIGLVEVFLTLGYLPKSVFAQCTTDAAGNISCPASGVLQIQELLSRIIGISVGIAFMALTVWLVWSAIKLFITSGGEPKAIQQAWQSVTWAFLGILFLALAWLALKLIESFTGVEVTKFCIGFPGDPRYFNNCPGY